MKKIKKSGNDPQPTPTPTPKPIGQQLGEGIIDLLGLDPLEKVGKTPTPTARDNITAGVQKINADAYMADIEKHNLAQKHHNTLQRLKNDTLGKVKSDRRRPYIPKK